MVPKQIPKPLENAVPRDQVRFEPGQSEGIGKNVDVTLFDVDGDDDIDIVCGSTQREKARLYVFLNDGTGAFPQSESIEMHHHVRRVLAHDLDRDGDKDVIVNFVQSNEPCRVLQNTGGKFSDMGVQIGTNNSYMNAVADFNRDGQDDVFCAQPGHNEIWFGDGAGRFTNSGQRLGTGDSNCIAVGDLDGDGDPDVSVANSPNSLRDSAQDRIWFNDGKGQMSEHQRHDSSNNHAVALCDFDRDGNLDQFLHDSIWLNDGHGTMHLDRSSVIGPTCDGCVFADLDRDGFPDILAVTTLNGPNSDLFVWWNDRGHFGAERSVYKGKGGRGLQVADLDNDGDLDIVIAGEHGNSVWINQTPLK